MGGVILPSSELPGRHHLQTRMRVDFVEVLERTRQLRQHRWRVTQVHTAQVVALEGVHEALRPCRCSAGYTRGVLVGFRSSDLAMPRVSCAM